MYNAGMTHTVRIQAKIPASRRLEIMLPEEIPSGDADLVVSVTPREKHETTESIGDAPRIRTFSELLSSEFAGMWADRDDLPKTDDEFREWRRRLWERKRG